MNPTNSVSVALARVIAQLPDEGAVLEAHINTQTVRILALQREVEELRWNHGLHPGEERVTGVSCKG